MKSMDVTNLSEEEIARKFIDYVSALTANDLKKSYANDITIDEDGQQPIGKFRLIHIYEPGTDEYLTFTVNFFMNNGKYTMEVYNLEKRALIIQCIHDLKLPSWISNITYDNINLSEVICTDMAVKLKSVLK